MTYTEIRKLLSKYPDIGREWWVTKFISTADKPNDILWIGGGNSWNKTTGATNSRNEDITIYDDKTQLCVTFLGYQKIYDIDMLEDYWLNRIKIHDELKKGNKIMLNTKPPFTSFVGC